MKALNQFSQFDSAAFFNGKKLMTTACAPWNDFDTKAHLGTKVTVAFVEDKTLYKPGKNGVPINNLFEKLDVKIAKDINVPVGVLVEVVNPVCTIYGDKRNQLSVKAEDVRVLQTK